MDDQPLFLECWEVKQAKRAELKALTQIFLDNGGKIKKFNIIKMQKINFYQILEKYDISEEKLRKKINSGQFAQPVTGGHSCNTRAEDKKWFVNEVEWYLIWNKKGFGDRG